MPKRHIFIAVICGLALLPVVGITKGTSLFDRLDQYFETTHFSTREDIQHVRIAGVDLWIPNNYKMGSYPNKGVDQPAVLIQVLLPNFEPRTEENIDGFTKGLGWGNRSHIMIKDISQWVTPAFFLNKVFENHPSLKLLAPEYELVHYRSPDPNDGIVHYEVYLEGTRDDFSSYILCEPLVEKPGCYHHFSVDGMYIKISYAKIFLPQWKDIQNKFLNLLTKLRTKPLEGQPI